MNDILVSLCFFSFFALTPILLVIKFVTNRPAWWLIIITIVVFGWGLVVGTYVTYHLGINDLIAQGKDEELPEGWDSDGASGLFAIFGGWFFSIVYMAPWLVIYVIAAGIRRLVQPNHAPNKSMQSAAATPRR